MGLGCTLAIQLTINMSGWGHHTHTQATAWAGWAQGTVGEGVGWGYHTTPPQPPNPNTTNTHCVCLGGWVEGSLPNNNTHHHHRHNTQGSTHRWGWGGRWWGGGWGWGGWWWCTTHQHTHNNEPCLCHPIRTTHTQVGVGRWVGECWGRHTGLHRWGKCLGTIILSHCHCLAGTAGVTGNNTMSGNVWECLSATTTVTGWGRWGCMPGGVVVCMGVAGSHTHTHTLPHTTHTGAGVRWGRAQQ